MSKCEHGKKLVEKCHRCESKWQGIERSTKEKKEALLPPRWHIYKCHLDHKRVTAFRGDPSPEEENKFMVFYSSQEHHQLLEAAVIKASEEIFREVLDVITETGNPSQIKKELWNAVYDAKCLKLKPRRMKNES